MNGIKIELSKSIRVIIVLLISFISLKAFAYSLPERNIRDNIEKSIAQLEEESVYPKPFYNIDSEAFVGQRLDNYTDAIFLDAAYIQSEIPLFKAVFGDFVMGGKGNNPVERLSDAIQRKQIGEEVGTYDYSRQWFGGEVILRTLLMFFTYPQIRIVMQVSAIVLLVMGCLSLLKNIGINAMWAYLIGILCINPIIAASSFNLANGLFVTLVSSIIISRFGGNKSDIAIMLAIGGCTSYFDLFAAPFLTYTVCVQVFLMKKLKQEEMNWKTSFFYLVKVSMGWVIGYLLCWSVKWLLASLALDRNLFQEALNEMVLYTSEYRPSWGPETNSELIKEALKLNIINLFPINIMYENPTSRIFFLVTGTVLLLIRIGRNKSLNLNINYYIYILAAMAPYVWYIVVHVHSYVHFWFQYRLQAGTIIGIIFVCLELTETTKAKIAEGKNKN